MKKWIAGAAVAVAGCVCALESHVEGIVSNVLEQVAALKKARPDAVPMAFWDFDGTIIRGDISTGLTEGGVRRYDGLMQTTVAAGFSAVYQTKADADRYLNEDYPAFKKYGTWLAYPFIGQSLRGADAAQVLAFCRAQAETCLRKWYFESSVHILDALEKAGVENVVISASPDIFVKGMAASLGLPEARCHGVKVRIDAAGKITTDILYPITDGDGKTELLKSLVAARPGGVAVAAFGNSYRTDGSFLKHVSAQTDLPGGARPLAMMINGGRDTFDWPNWHIVNQERTVSGLPRETPVTEKRVGIVGLDTSHATAFTKLLNVTRDKPVFREFRVTAAYPQGSLDIVSSTNRIPEYTAEVRKMGVEIVGSLRELIDCVDVICLETNDGRRHLEQAREIFKSGKPVFIDKPIAADLADARAIVAEARACGAKFFCSSALRFTEKVRAARAGRWGRFHAVDAYAPGTVEPHHSAHYWYAIHAAEPLFAVMGTGCTEVTAVHEEKMDVVVGRWADGRLGTMRASRENARPYHITGYSDKGFVDLGTYEGYQSLLEEILTFFKTGAVPVTPDETLEIYAFMTAAEESAKRGGAPVKLADVLK